MPSTTFLQKIGRADRWVGLASCLASTKAHKALARVPVGPGCLNTSQTVLKSLRYVDLFGRLWRGAS
ncbi:MAG: hypothetical protein MJE68_06865 [Proteobacteria bacterium]|nr:hypothetical protein [Pseudomonadota bacterium]